MSADERQIRAMIEGWVEAIRAGELDAVVADRSEDIESAHFSGQLVERVGWAVRDAVQIERDDSRVTPIRREI